MAHRPDVEPSASCHSPAVRVNVKWPCHLHSHTSHAPSACPARLGAPAHSAGCNRRRGPKPSAQRRHYLRRRHGLRRPRLLRRPGHDAEPRPHGRRRACASPTSTSRQAVCSASRAALLTGLLLQPRRHPRARSAPTAKIGIRDNETTLARAAARRAATPPPSTANGTSATTRSSCPTRHGFDEYFGLPYSNDMWPKHPTGDVPGPAADRGREGRSRLNPDQSQADDAGTPSTPSAFIERNKDKPFFLYVPHTMPHVPLFVVRQVQGQVEAAGCTAT